MVEPSNIAGIDHALRTTWDKAPFVATSISLQGGKPVSFAPVINPPAPETMIERMARALCQCDEQDGAAPWDWYDDKGKDRYRASARAILAVMREPIISALKPFADCAEELDGSQDTPRAPDGEWAKFRLLTDDYRRARDVVAMIDVAVAESVVPCEHPHLFTRDDDRAVECIGCGAVIGQRGHDASLAEQG